MKVGLIGAGTMGRRHLEALSGDTRIEIVAVADAVESSAQKAAASVGTRACATLADLEESGAEAIFVTLPNVYHAPIVLEALDRGLHVFSEKPMATTLADARRIADRVKAVNRVYQIGFNRRWAPAYRYLRKQIENGFTPYSANGKFNDGDMLTPGWFTDVTISGGFMYDTVVHLIDLVAWLIGPIDMVTALGRRSCYPDYDGVALLLRCCGDRPVAITTCGHASWAAPQERIELYGDHALLMSEDLDRVRFSTRDDPGAEWQRLSAPDALTLSGYIGEDRAFIDACLGLAPPAIPVDDGLHTIAVLDAAYTSIERGGRPVHLRG